MSTKTEQLIKQELAEIEKRNKNIEHLREVQYRQELIDVLSDKKSTEEQIATVAKAFFDNYMRKVRMANMEKAREARKNMTPEEKEALKKQKEAESKGAV